MALKGGLDKMAMSKGHGKALREALLRREAEAMGAIGAAAAGGGAGAALVPLTSAVEAELGLLRAAIREAAKALCGGKEGKGKGKGK